MYDPELNSIPLYSPSLMSKMLSVSLHSEVLIFNIELVNLPLLKYSPHKLVESFIFTTELVALIVKLFYWTLLLTWLSFKIINIELVKLTVNLNSISPRIMPSNESSLKESGVIIELFISMVFFNLFCSKIRSLGLDKESIALLPSLELHITSVIYWSS